MRALWRKKGGGGKAHLDHHVRTRSKDRFRTEDPPNIVQKQASKEERPRRERIKVQQRQRIERKRERNEVREDPVARVVLSEGEDGGERGEDDVDHSEAELAFVEVVFGEGELPLRGTRVRGQSVVWKESEGEAAGRGKEENAPC